MIYNQDPQYDDIQLAQISELQLEDLVGELVAYILFLRNTAANLRKEVNDLSHCITHRPLQCTMKFIRIFAEPLKIPLLMLISRNSWIDLFTNEAHLMHIATTGKALNCKGLAR